MWLLFSRIFMLGGCYGLFRMDDMILQSVGIFFAIGLVLDGIYKIKIGRLTL
tara:strand:+ start:1491 stop:1646 length:156 start_codon:yes stop_codon:yes gene_type:complete